MLNAEAAETAETNPQKNSLRARRALRLNVAFFHKLSCLWFCLLPFAFLTFTFFLLPSYFFEVSLLSSSSQLKTTMRLAGAV